MYNNSCDLSLYLIQLQYVVPRIAFDPSTICHILNICPRWTPSAQLLANDSIRNLFHQLLSKAKAKNTYSPSKHHLPSLSNSSHSVNKQEKPLGKKPVKSTSGKITFLQLADIHLDRDYAEVSPSNCKVAFIFAMLNMQGSYRL